MLSFAVLLLGAAALYRYLSQEKSSLPPDDQSGTQQEEESTKAPDFTMLDWEGNSAALSDFAGKPVVLNFWASWCGPCKSEMPVFDLVAAEFGDRLNFMMVNLTDGGRETEEGARGFIEGAGYSFPVFFDTLLEGASAYSVRSIPVTYFIDAEGNVLAYSAGIMDEESLRSGIDMIIDK